MVIITVSATKDIGRHLRCRIAGSYQVLLVHNDFA